MIEFDSVGKTFRDGTAAVVDLSLTVPTGQITVVVGPSGCGKTTTLRMVNRMIEPTSGRITWDGAPLRAKRKTTLRRQMGYVIQSGGLFPHRSVLDNIGTVPGLLGWSRAKTRARSLDLLGSVGLDPSLADRYPAQLSGGQQQRVGVARALAADPLVMLMDEPFSAVDPVVRGELHEFFLGLQRKLSKTIILITHDIDEAIKLGDQVAILRVGGTLAQVGSPQQLLNEPADSFVEGFVGRDRGYRSLSFMPADTLSLERVQAVRDADSRVGAEPTLLVDGDAHPVGWLDPARPGRPLPLGSVFDPETDTLRAALDAALTSPTGLAVAVVKSTGRYGGVVGAEQILRQVSTVRAAQLETVQLRRDGADPAAGPTSPGEAGGADAEAWVEPAPAEPTAADVAPLASPSAADVAPLASPGAADVAPLASPSAADVAPLASPSGDGVARAPEIELSPAYVPAVRRPEVTPAQTDSDQSAERATDGAAERAADADSPFAADDAVAPGLHRSGEQDEPERRPG